MTSGHKRCNRHPTAGRPMSASAAMTTPSAATGGRQCVRRAADASASSGGSTRETPATTWAHSAPAVARRRCSEEADSCAASSGAAISRAREKRWSRRESKSGAPSQIASCVRGSARLYSDLATAAGHEESSRTLSPRRSPCTAHSSSAQVRPEPGAPVISTGAVGRRTHEATAVRCAASYWMSGTGRLASRLGALLTGLSPSPPSLSKASAAKWAAARAPVRIRRPAASGACASPRERNLARQGIIAPTDSRQCSHSSRLRWSPLVVLVAPASPQPAWALSTRPTHVTKSCSSAGDAATARGCKKGAPDTSSWNPSGPRCTQTGHNSTASPASSVPPPLLAMPALAPGVSPGSAAAASSSSSSAASQTHSPNSSRALVERGRPVPEPAPPNPARHTGPLVESVSAARAAVGASTTAMPHRCSSRLRNAHGPAAVVPQPLGRQRKRIGGACACSVCSKGANAA
eukprot:scaffold1182_cov124-Isochrysis_galbana.AAC.15